MTLFKEKKDPKVYNLYSLLSLPSQDHLNRATILWIRYRITGLVCTIYARRFLTMTWYATALRVTPKRVNPLAEVSATGKQTDQLVVSLS